MRKILFILLLSAPCLAAGPKYSYQDPHLNDEMQNIYKDIPNLLKGNVRIASVTILTATISTMTVSSFTSTNSTITFLTVGSIASTTTAVGALTDSSGYILGSVIQSSQSVSTGTTAAVGTSYTATATSATITPHSTSSRIKITVVGTFSNPVLATALDQVSIFRNSTDLGAADGSGFITLNGNITGVLRVPVSIVYIDSPATTSATTYTVRIKSDTAGKANWNENGSRTVILLEELRY